MSKKATATNPVRIANIQNNWSKTSLVISKPRITDKKNNTKNNTKFFTEILNPLLFSAFNGFLATALTVRAGLTDFLNLFLAIMSIINNTL